MTATVIPDKKGLRALGIAESFHGRPGSKAILAGVVMRRDLLIDGVVLGSCTVGGMDSTESVIEMWRSLNRGDINLIMLNGCIISLFNIIDLNAVFEQTKKPVICVTYESSDGLENRIKKRFDRDWDERLKVYLSNGPRYEVRTREGHAVYVRSIGLSPKTTSRVLRSFTVSGRIPEPLRLAKLIARAAQRLSSSTYQDSIAGS
ncbi:MAG: DUF99 family protein [Aigarchaeota archaeon]|nr:DUF99 family protein [Aigarchaeota archaeon]MDW8093216.1 DUF99 family protein [Nitrososphaerota archaeon]